MRIKEILSERGLIDAPGIDTIEDAYQMKTGARMVARAWPEPEFRALALKDAKTTTDKVYPSRLRDNLVVVEDLTSVYNFLFCTRCSWCHVNKVHSNNLATLFLRQSQFIQSARLSEEKNWKYK